MIVGPFPPPVHGEAAAMELASRFIPDKKIINLNHSNLTYRKISLWKNFLGDLRGIFQYVYYCLTADMVYLSVKRSFLGSVKDIFFVYYASWFSKKIILHIHSGGYRTFYDRMPGLYKYFLRQTLRKSLRVIVLSRYSFERMAGLCPAERLIIVPNGIATSGVRTKKYNRSEPLKILYVSHVVKEKGILVFEELAARAVHAGKNWRFDFFGAMNDSEVKIKLACNGLNNFRYKGLLSGNKYRVMARYDILIFPSSLEEGQPLVLLEAMSAGLAVLANNTGGVCDIIGSRNGALINGNQPEDYFSRLMFLDKNRDVLKRKGLHNLNEFKKKYSFERFEKNITGVLLSE